MNIQALINMILGEADPNFKDTHKHRCGYAPRGEPRVAGCGQVWEHDRPPLGASHAEYDVAHTCPGCGIVNKWRYQGRVPRGQRTGRKKL